MFNYRDYKPLKLFMCLILVVCLSFTQLGFKKIDLKTTSIRTAAVLTTGYEATATRQIDQYSHLTLLVKYTKGSSTEMRLKVEFSENKTDFYQETSAEVKDGMVKHVQFYRWMDASGNYPIQIPILGSWYKASVIAITSGSGTSCAITEVKGKI